MLLNKKILLTAAASVIANITPASAQTFYQCIPNACSNGYYFNGTGCVKAGVACGANEVEKNGTCYSLNTSGNWTLLYNYTSGQGSATLAAGWYIVSLHGGNSGDNLGGIVTYMFKEDKSWTFKYGVGQNGDEVCGGGGSWISINNQYIVAGGAGGHSIATGGAIGSGSCGFTGQSSYIVECNKFRPLDILGSSGNYERSQYSGCKARNIGSSEEDIYIYCYDGVGINSVNAGYCGNMETFYNPENLLRAGRLGGVSVYPGSVNSNVGGDPGVSGSASHVTNVNISGFGCGTSAGCVKLWKFNYN